MVSTRRRILIMKDITDLLQQMLDEITIRFAARIQFWNVVLDIVEIQNVLGGLLARNCSLGIEFVLSPHFWNPLCSSVILRAMSEVIINMGWIALDPAARAKLFVDYGLGQDKLDYEHLRAGNKSYTLPVDQLAEIADGLAAQRHLIFTDVNVGTWSSTSVSRMAAEAGLSDFAVMFAGACGTVHSNWLLLHDRFIDEPPNDIPDVPDLMPVKSAYLCAVATYLDKAFEIFDAVCDYPEQDEGLLLDLVYSYGST